MSASATCARAPRRPEYVRLPRARAHTGRSLAQLRHATAAHERSGGIGPGEMPPALAALMPRWHRRDRFLRHLDWLATQPHVQDLCRKHEIAVDTWKANMVNDTLDADIATGRSMETSQAVAASRISRDVKQVQRARDVSVQLGIMVMYYAGRQLTRAEHQLKRKGTPGSMQEGIPNAYAMGVCPPRQRRQISVPEPGEFAQVKANVHLYLCTPESLFTHLSGPLTIAAANASREEEAPPAPPPRRKQAPGWTLANEMLAHPGLQLFTSVPTTSIAAQLTPYRQGGWHGLDLADVLIQTAIAMHIDHTRVARFPYAALKALLSRVEPIYDAASQVPDRAVEPCGRPGCDTGWIQTGENAAAKCPHCPPAVRAGPPMQDEPPW